MKKFQKKQLENFTELLSQAHDEIRKLAESKNDVAAMGLLEQCQEGAVEMGDLIEKTEGEGFPTISRLEDYCELVYEIHESLAQEQEINANKIYKRLRKSLIQVENSIRNDIKARLEMVFLPYKASMWDSLESVWQAANADPDCDAYVVPIPYYDRNPDGSFGKYHYEGNDLPAYVPILNYEAYRLEDRNPDAVFIHNPYDNMNYVTSVDPRFYSGELKKHTGCLIYIPYYSTSGGMGEGQALCPAYCNVDYIIIQAEKYRKFFDPSIPQEKLVPLGSPKFDRVMRMCKNPPEPPAEWKEKTQGRKVYFYNTSINGMLENTDAFLKKMRYVFDTFRGRKDACLLWRPHPLMESTFDSMRKEFRPQYDALKREFIEEDIGILDDTPDITSTVALSDVYIGDAATSVTSLFGVAGKPLFILNNLIHSAPQEDDWRGEKINIVFDAWGNDRYQVTANNQLWFSEKNDYHYKFYMDLGTGYSGGGYYSKAVEIKDKIYVIPANAQHILIIKDKKARKINLEIQIVQAGAFWGCWYNEKYIFLFPNQYPLLVRFDLETEEIRYIDGIRNFNVRNVCGECRIGGVGVYENELVFASPDNNQFLFLNISNLKIRFLSNHSTYNLGTQTIVPDGDDLWLLPLNGKVITCWNPKTSEIKEYNQLPPDFRSVKWPYEYECEERPYGNIAISRSKGKKNVIISPCWGNMYLSLDKKTGEMKEWKTPMLFNNRGKNGYFAVDGMGGFVITVPQYGKADCRIWYAPERKIYDVNIDTGNYKEVKIEFDYDELKEHEAGFMETSENLQYCLGENAFNSLINLLEGDITGNPFSKERQVKAFSKINANVDGTCGENIYHFVYGKL